MKKSYTFYGVSVRKLLNNVFNVFCSSLSPKEVKSVVSCSLVIHFVLVLEGNLFFVLKWKLVRPKTTTYEGTVRGLGLYERCHCPRGEGDREEARAVTLQTLCQMFCKECVLE